MTNPMKLKSTIKKISKEKGISAQLVLQNYMLERLLERISVSRYKRYFILKGGFLIAAMVGLDSRATMDMDITIKDYPINEETIMKMFQEICTVDLNDSINFTFRNIGEIREEDEYTGYRVSLTANYPPMAVPLKLDITTGDKITPQEITFQFELLLEDRSIFVLAYNLETILSEKLETVISRGDQNTRLRDFYDIYTLYKLYNSKINIESLKAALQATTDKRETYLIIQDYQKIMEVIKNSSVMLRRWSDYQKDFDYAKGISFTDICDLIVIIMKQLM